jgi:hypothetical protein
MPHPADMPRAFVLTAALVAGCGASSDLSSEGGTTCGPRYGAGWGAALADTPSGPMAVTTDERGHVAYATIDSSTGQGRTESRDPQGAILWSSPVGAWGLALAPDGGVYLTGVTPPPKSGGTAALVTRLDTTGAVTWSRALSATANEWAGSFVAIEPAGGVWVVGTERYISRVPQGGQSQRPFIAHLDERGQVLRLQPLGDLTGFVTPRGLAVDSEGRVLIALSLTQGSLSIGAATYDVSHGAVVAAFAPDGTPQWSRAVSATSDDQIMGLARGDDGSLYVTGQTLRSMLGTATTLDGFVMGLTPEGVVRWRRTYESSGAPTAAARPCGGVRLAMLDSADPVTFILVVDLDAAGNEARRRSANGACATAGSCNVVLGDIAAHGSDGLILTGAFSGYGTFDALRFATNESEELFVARLAD